MYLVTSEQMNELDRRTISSRHIPGILLMEHAGKAVAEVVLQKHPSMVAVLCGKGNNGGDGWIAARWLKHFGVAQVLVISTVAPGTLHGDAALAADMAIASGVPYEVLQPDNSLPTADVYVDALLGTGVTRPVTGQLAELIAAVNHMSPYTVAVDVPSGVDASTGRVLAAELAHQSAPEGVAIRAHVTVAMSLQKLGTAVTPGSLYAGQVQVVDIGIERPTEPAADEEFAVLTSSAWVRGILPRRPANAHKGTFGKVGVAVGSMHGAAVLAGLGAARSGAGLVVLAGSEMPMNAPVDFVLRKHAADPFMHCDSVVIGPGLGSHHDQWTSVVKKFRGSGVMDADGLQLLDQLAPLSDQWVLTPHPKECGQLLGWTTAQVQAERIRAAQTLARQTQAIVVLKGYGSVIAHPYGRLCINPTGDASLATAGTGDVLAGMIGGLLAQGLNGFDAATAGAYLHGLAGELAGRSLSMASVMASDVVDLISRAIRLHFDTDPGESS